MRLAVGLILPAATVGSQLPALHTREYFYIGGKYTGQAGSELMAGQMYVEVLRPQRATRKYPLVMIHGLGQTATNWIGTPDSRPGWADYFLNQGYTVYLVDQPARGRSPWQPTLNGPVQVLSAPYISRHFTASEVIGNWPQGKKPAQWPGDSPKKNQMGDPMFDAFYATQVESLASAVETQTMIQAAGSALLDKIGPAIVLTHSQSGAFGWLLADSRPKAVKAIVAVEPNGPPFQNAVVNEDKNRAWGITDIPITYDPPAKAPSELATVRESQPDGPDLTACWKQADPPRRMPNLTGIPVLIVTGEASFHAPYDHCTSKYLTQAGVKNTFIRLEDAGIRGNGHMMMLEKNSFEIAALLEKWIAQRVK
jgi:pimeloyl-ACP methyl ester carboxylesterase